LYLPSLVDRRAALLPLDDTLKNVYDPYAFIRDAYLARRAYLVSDGKVTDEEPLEDPGADMPDTAPTSSAPPAFAAPATPPEKKSDAEPPAQPPQ
jgi:phospholipid-binding lipoprotein MlaA